MLDDHADASAPTTDQTADSPSPGSGPEGQAPAAKKTARKRAAKKTAPAPDGDATPTPEGDAAQAAEKPAKKTARKRTTKKVPASTEDAATTVDSAGDDPEPRKKSTRAKAASKAAAGTADEKAPAESGRPSVAAVFQAPETTPGSTVETQSAPPAKASTRRTSKKSAAAPDAGDATKSADDDGHAGEATDDRTEAGDGDGGDAGARRKRRRGGRRRRGKSGSGENGDGEPDSADGEGDASGADEASAQSDDGEGSGSASSRRRRRRRRTGEEEAGGSDDPANTVTRVRSGRSASDEITAVSGSTRLEAKKQRRREGREAGRRRAPIVSEAEFLARRESVNRVMVIRQRGDVTQIGVLEDNVLVEHYVARESQTSLIGNVYLGRVQNVLPSMEAAFIDIGKGRNAVLYAGEVNWSALGHKDGQPRKIESVLSSGQTVLVQVTKDPIGHKGARLTSQVSLAGRFLVYVPDGTTSGISRKLPDTERNRLKTLLKEIVPEHAGVIVRTAAEGAAEDELTRDVERLTARWDDIEKKAKGSAPQLLYGEPDLTLKVVRDLFTEDFAKLVIEGDDAWETVRGYVEHVAPDLGDRLERYEPAKGQDVFAAYRIDEQIKKGLDRKVWLPSGGSLIIDRTEAMTVVDVNTGKFTGSGGNLEETVTKNNLEAAEEIVRQLRLRDIGGIIVVDFIDMVLESNRDLVLRRLVECLGRDRTRHQVAEVTSLGLVQMTRKRIGTGLLESFSHDCPHCHGRGVVIEEGPVEPRKSEEEPRRARSRRSRGGRGQDETAPEPAKPPSPKDIAAMARHHDEHADEDADELDETQVEPEVETEVETEAAPEVEPEAAPEVEPEVETEAAEPEVLADDATDAPAATTEEVAPEPEPEAAEAAPDAAAELDPEPQQAAEPEKPRVVTRTRRRAASRPAGPPAATAHDELPALGGSGDGGAAGEVAAPPEEQPTDEAPALHVPVKRKGTRKR